MKVTTVCLSQSKTRKDRRYHEVQSAFCPLAVISNVYVTSMISAYASRVKHWVVETSASGEFMIARAAALSLSCFLISKKYSAKEHTNGYLKKKTEKKAYVVLIPLRRVMYYS